MTRIGLTQLLLPTLFSTVAFAQAQPPLGAPAAAPATAEAADTPEPADAESDAVMPVDTQTQINDLRERMLDLEQRLDQTRQVATARRPIVSVGGYIDAGFFASQGTGAGIIQDSGAAGDRAYPEYMNRYGWVFLGDLLSTAINSRGEAADLGEFAGIDRFDSVNSNGAPGFIINEVNLTLNAALSPSALATASVNFIPRSGHDFNLGDFIEVDIAQLEWMPTRDGRTSVFVGKVDSVIGIEYRERKASQRFGITPTLLARYTTGTPIGLKVRSKFLDGDRIVVAAALTNGSSTTEQFHFYDEVDSNAGKTASGRLSLKPVPALDLEIGLSGEYGSQDRALDSLDPLWFWGVDLLGHVGPVDIKAQYLRGRSEGERADRVYDPNHRPYGLDLKNGAYLELDWMITPVVGVYGRGELRDALVWLGNPDSLTGTGNDRLYITKSWRAVGGARAVINEHIVVKAEYLHNGEYGRIPELANDVFTSSLVLIY
ncbi:MAG TPA: hypothetical protein VIQ54_15995 [Polyangia bacterium]